MGPAGAGQAHARVRLQCHGCRRVVDIARPADIPFSVTRERVASGEMITIMVGCVVVHRCLLCADGQWR